MQEVMFHQNATHKPFTLLFMFSLKKLSHRTAPSA